ncbi:MAG: ATP-binding protein [Candidatus Helarchaeota archaeon]
MDNKKKVIGNLIGSTRPSEVRIVVDPDTIRTAPLQIGEYVMVEYPRELLQNHVIAFIYNLQLENLTIPESLMRSPESYEKLKILGDLKLGEKLVAYARIIGYYDLDIKTVVMPRYPPIPGANVYRADKQILKDIFSQGDVEVGVLRAHPDVRVKLDVNELVRRHTAILAITGAGKGNTVAIISSKILELNGSIIIIDPHEEYPHLRKIYGDRIVVFFPKEEPGKGYYPIQFKLSNFGPEEIMDILDIRDNASNQQALVNHVLEELKDKDWDFNDFQNTMDDYLKIDESLPEKDVKKKKKEVQRLQVCKYVIKDKIKMIREATILHKTSEIPIYDEGGPSLVKKGQITVICVSGLSLKVQQVIVSRIAEKIYNAGVSWRRKIEDRQKLPGPVFLIIEEAHNFIPIDMKAKSFFPIRRIAAEGRKFGIGLCIVSQRPGKVHSDILSQCNSQIILKVVNPIDQNQIINSNEAISSDLMSDLPSLNKGEAVVTGPCIPIPSLIKIHKFEGELGGDDIDILKEWQSTSKNGENSYPNDLGNEKIQDFKSEDKLIRGKKW